MGRTATGHDYRQVLGSRIRILRTSQGFSLRQFGSMVGMDWQHLMNVELGRHGVTIDALVKIADGLGVQVRDLIDF